MAGAVPNTDTFSMNQVATVLYGGPSAGQSLSAMFTSSTDALFDPAYKGSKNSLLNFRNYGAGPNVKYADIFVYKIGNPTDNLFVEIRSGSYTGTVLGTSASVNGSTLLTTVTQKRFTFATPVTLNRGTQYWLRVNRSGALDTINYYKIDVWSSTNSYSGGNFGRATTAYLTWDMGLILTDSNSVTILTISRAASNIAWGSDTTNSYIWQSFTL